MNFRTIALAGIAALAFGSSAAAFAQTTPGTAGTPPPSPAPTDSSAPSAAPTEVMTPTPPPPTPIPTATPEGRHRRRGGAPTAKASPSPEASETPEPPQFSTLDGVWEVQLQPLSGARTQYSHLYIVQNGNLIAGTWAVDKKHKYGISGTFDGRLFKITASTDIPLTSLPATPAPAVHKRQRRHHGAVADASPSPTPVSTPTTAAIAANPTPEPGASGGPTLVFTLSGYVENYGDMVGMLTDTDPKTPLGTPFTASHRKRTELPFGKDTKNGGAGPLGGGVGQPPSH